MGLQKATYTGREQILDAFDAVTQENNMYFSVWHSVDHIAFQWPYNDMTKGRDFLDKNLAAMEQAGNDNLLYLKFHPESAVKQGDYIDKKTKVVSMSPVRVTDIDTGYEPAVSGSPAVYQVAGRDQIPAKLYDVLQNLDSSIRPLNEKITDIDTRLKELEQAEYEETAPVTVVGQIGELFNKNPDLSNAVISALPGLVNAITGMFSRFMPPGQAPVIAQAINGTEPEPTAQANGGSEPLKMQKVDEDLLNESLITLAQNGMLIDTDLALLAKLATTNKTMFDMVLNQLRLTAKI